MIRNIVFICLVALTALPGTAQQTNQPVVISDTFAFASQKPLFFTTGTSLYIKCDTVYMLNKHTMDLYKAVGAALKQRTGLNTCNLVVQNLENRLEEQNRSYIKLYQDYLKLDSVSQQTISDTRNSLVQVNNILVKTQTDITVVDKKMDDIKATINEQRRRSFFDKILFGAGGIAVGILGGLLIAN